METHYHRCGGCGLVWGHPDRNWAQEFGRGSPEFKDAHTCPRKCPGLWTEHYDPKRITLEMLVGEEACPYGIAKFKEAYPEGFVVVSAEAVKTMPDDIFHEYSNFVAWTFLREEEFREWNVFDRYTEHIIDESRCMGCEALWMMFVRLFNREERK